MIVHYILFYTEAQLILLQVHIFVSQKRFLPIESCGGVDICSNNGRYIVKNSLAVRLDLVLQKACPIIRAALYGLNANRTFFDLSKISGSSNLLGVSMLDEKKSIFGGDHVTLKGETIKRNNDQNINFLSKTTQNYIVSPLEITAQ